MQWVVSIIVVNWKELSSTERERCPAQNCSVLAHENKLLSSQWRRNTFELDIQNGAAYYNGTKRNYIRAR